MTATPHDDDAEKAVLGALLSGADLLDSAGLEVQDFYKPVHERVFRAMQACWSERHALDSIVLKDELIRAGDRLPEVGGLTYLVDLVDAAPVAGDAEAHIEILKRHAAARRALEAIGRAQQRIEQGADPAEALADLGSVETSPSGPKNFSFASGGSFLLDGPDHDVPLWGTDPEILWSLGEALQIAGPQGTFKSTLAQNLALARCGFSEFADVLGSPVMPGKVRTLYLAMDRPRQIRRSLRRMVGSAWRAELDDKLVVWEGPPPMPFTAHPALLVEMARAAEADTIIVDSLKDAATKLSDDEQGAAWNRARQLALVAGIQVLEVHHTRKLPQGNHERRTIDDIYGSTWVTSGCGSILLLDGAAGDPLVKVWHVKQPMDEVGPLTMTTDPSTGIVEIRHAHDVVALVRGSGTVTATDVAKDLFETDKPTPAQREKARRKLTKLVEQGLLQLATESSAGAGSATSWEVSA